MLLVLRFLEFSFWMFFFLILLTSGTVFAVKVTYESYIAVDPSKIEFVGEFPGGQFGATIGAGDLNGDNFEDLIIGAPFASPDARQWSGAVKVVFGGLEAETVITGENAGDQLGTSLAIGDFNNDGIDDLAIGAYKAQFENQSTGKVYVLYGRKDIDDNQIFLKEVPADLTIARGLTGQGFASKLLSTDLNGDGFHDLLVGAPLPSNWLEQNHGFVYGYFGGSEGLSSTYSVLFFGQGYKERFGSSMASGDFDGNGVQEMAIGSYMFSQDFKPLTGKVRIFDLSELIGNDESESFKISDISLAGNWPKEFFGFDVAVGNLNGDGSDDLAIGSFPYAGDKKAAKVSIFFGNDNLGDAPDITIEHPIGDAMLGARINLEDLNNDGIDDIILGAPGISLSKSHEPGMVYIIYSTPDGFKSHYSVAGLGMDSITHGENPDDWFGYSVESLDFNNDGYMDLAIGSRYSDTEDATNNGKVFVLLSEEGYFGKPLSVSLKEDQVKRGELVSMIIKSFDLEEKKNSYIQNCYDHIDFCLFNFMAMSTYNEIILTDPIVLYPDITPEDPYYNDVNTATILGLVNGYLSEPDSPFKPDIPVTRIHALKVVLGAADLVPPKYKFELVAILGSYLDLLSQTSIFTDIDSKISHMWWYPRYVNFAVDAEIIDSGEYFRPDEYITAEEITEMMNRTLDYLNNQNAEVDL